MKIQGVTKEVGCLDSPESFLFDLQFSSFAVLQFDDSITGRGAQNWHKRKENTGIYECHFGSGEIIIAAQVVARLQFSCVQLHWLRTRVAVAPHEHVLLNFIMVYACAVYNDVPQADLSELIDFLLRKNAGMK